MSRPIGVPNRNVKFKHLRNITSEQTRLNL